MKEKKKQKIKEKSIRKFRKEKKGKRNEFIKLELLKYYNL